MGHRTSPRPYPEAPIGECLRRRHLLDTAALLTARNLDGLTDASTVGALHALIGEADNLRALVDGFADRATPAVRRFDDSLRRYPLSDGGVEWLGEQSGYARLTGLLAVMGLRLFDAADGRIR